MTINISTDRLFKALHFLTLAAILGLLIWSAPWDSNSNAVDRRITVTGESIIEATPDEFTFSPSFQKTGSDKEALQSELNVLAETTVEKLKELGVPEEKITLNASSYDRWYYRDGEDGVLNVYLEVEVPAGEIVQKVQDYLLSVKGIEGQISPRATFSQTKQKELEDRAVEEASNDAKKKAEDRANLFNAKLGKVISIDQGYDSIFRGYGLNENTVALDAIAEDTTSLPVLPGQNDYRQTVSVIYELK